MLRKFTASLVSLCWLSSSAWSSDCTGTSVGFIPLNDLGEHLYQGFPGGLYPNGRNMRPAGHDLAGLSEAAQVVPRDGAGAPAANGRIVLLSIGMSNTTQEFSRFVTLANGDPEKNPAVVPVNGAHGGVTAADMADPNDPYWPGLLQVLQQAGVTRQQVQAIWLKQANRPPFAAFPDHALDLKNDLIAVLRNLRALFPNARLCYLASRIYAGYATTSLNPEPIAYEQGFAVKWTIQDQINGRPALNFDPGAGPVVSPWLCYGTYNWADGLNPRSDGLIWECGDFEPDGTHPAATAEQKVAQALLEFLKVDATAKRWFLRSPTTLCPEQATVASYGTGFGGQNGIARLVASDLATVPTIKALRIHAYAAPANSTGALLIGFQPLPDGLVGLKGGSLLVDFSAVLPLASDSLGQASFPVGVIPDNPAICDLSVYFQYVVADPDSPFGYDLSRGLEVVVGH